MARQVLSKIEIPSIKFEGYNLIQSTDFVTLVPGSGNGVRFRFENDILLILKNTTGGLATFSLILPEIASVINAGGSIKSPEYEVGNNDQRIMKVDRAFIQSGKQIYLECDVAGEALLLATTA